VPYLDSRRSLPLGKCSIKQWTCCTDIASHVIMKLCWGSLCLVFCLVVMSRKPLSHVAIEALQSYWCSIMFVMLCCCVILLVIMSHCLLFCHIVCYFVTLFIIMSNWSSCRAVDHHVLVIMWYYWSSCDIIGHHVILLVIMWHYWSSCDIIGHQVTLLVIM